MSIALRARTTGALVGFIAASALVADIRVANARSTRGVFVSSLERDASSASGATDFGRKDGSDERGELVLGRAFRREVGRGWNAAVDGVFGAGVRALSDRGL